MDRKPDIQYVHQFYVYGSEAKAPELKVVKKRRPKLVLNVPKLRKDFLVRFDVASLCGIAVACVMMVLLTVGVYQLSSVQQDYARMERYVIQLQNENIKLEREYHASYDLNDIREKALALGMVPAEHMEVISIHVDTPQAEEAPGIWENIRWFCSGLFA